MEKLAGKPLLSSQQGLVYLHAHFCSILAGVLFCFWWVSASLLYFQSSTSSIFADHCRRAGAGAGTGLQVIPPHLGHQAHMLQIRATASRSSASTPFSPPRSTKSTSLPSSSLSGSSPSSAILPAMPITRPSIDSSQVPVAEKSQLRSSLSPYSMAVTPSVLPGSSLQAAPPPLYKHSQEAIHRVHPTEDHATIPNTRPQDSCHGKQIYIHSLPPIFNQEMISDCTNQTPTWVDMCKITSNGGLGPPLEDDEGVLSQGPDANSSWYNTEQFILDVIFHSRMKKYKCLTTDSSQADLIYVPFYAGLDLTRYLWHANVSVRDYLPKALAEWLPKQPEWKLMRGKDHFFVTGKISWDFRRTTEEDTDWGNKLLRLPALKDVSVLVIEKGPIEASDVEHALPYPTYFHPRRDSEVYEWQRLMREKKRVNLFAFAGASRPEMAHSIRGELIQQCKVSQFCKLLECTRGKSGCNSPTTVMKLFQESVFCLQPAGDSYTRRSVFDAMVSGCIPVLFHPYTLYAQYDWHLPQNHSIYSVFIPEEEIEAKTVAIEQVLQRIPDSQVKEMRERVISLIPSVIYAHPDHQLEKVKDAFDVAVEALLANVSASKKQIRERVAWLDRRIGHAL